MFDYCDQMQQKFNNMEGEVKRAISLGIVKILRKISLLMVL
ncbi:hypothetical protein SEHO0A_02829 [Salmonella enterica subsp. houtenae str. ATCC BAA-1581]|nr:hypothetical protein SEHO0A_02829 [Salmonella enterica subsp. houtenae str. ATCC BAA-1581]